MKTKFFWQTLNFLRNKPQYIAVFLVLIFVVFYHYQSGPAYPVLTQVSGKIVDPVEQTDLDRKQTSKIFSNVIHTEPGDAYRIGAYLKTTKEVTLEIFAQTPLRDQTKVGEWVVQPEEDGEYKETVFFASDRYEDVILALKDGKTEDPVLWKDEMVYIRSFFVTRVSIQRPDEIKSLNPTIFGIAERKQQLLYPENKNTASESSEWLFQAAGNFLDEIEFSGDIVGGGRQEHSFILAVFDPATREKKEKNVRKISFILDALGDYRLPSGNFHIALPAPLEQGKWYSLTLLREPSKDDENFFQLGTLGITAIDNIEEAGKEAEIGLGMGVWKTAKNGNYIPTYAKLEDRGNNDLLYTYSLQRKKEDFQNLFAASSGVSFDQSTGLVKGSQKRGEYFTYKFDTVYPFEKFVLQAEQQGDDQNEIKFEFSLDGMSWEEIPADRESVLSKSFSLVLGEEKGKSVVFVRASYNGKQKKTGFFALNALSVVASVPKP